MQTQCGISMGFNGMDENDGKAASAIPQEDERVIEGEQGLEQGYEG